MNKPWELYARNAAPGPDEEDEAGPWAMFQKAAPTPAPAPEPVAAPTVARDAGSAFDAPQEVPVPFSGDMARTNKLTQQAPMGLGLPDQDPKPMPAPTPGARGDRVRERIAARAAQRGDVSMPQQAPAPGAQPDATDDARARRGFGRSAAQSGGDEPQMYDAGMIRPEPAPEPVQAAPQAPDARPQQPQKGRLGLAYRQGEAGAIQRTGAFFRDIDAALEEGVVGRTFAKLRDAIGIEGEAPTERAARIRSTPGPFEAAAGKTLEEIAATNFQVTGLGDVKGLRTGVRFFTENLVSSLPQMGASIAAGGLSPLVTVGMLGAEANEELKEKTNLSEADRVAVATGAGVAMWGFEMFGLGRIVDGILPGDLAAQAIGGTLKETLTKRGMTSAAARIIEAGIAEGSTEAIQEGIIIGVTAASGGEYTAEEVQSRLTEAFAAGGAVGSGLRAGGEALTAATGREDEISANDAPPPLEDGPSQRLARPDAAGAPRGFDAPQQEALPPNITEEDAASPIRNDMIARGKDIIERAQGGFDTMADDVDLPEGAVSSAVLYDEIEEDVVADAPPAPVEQPPQIEEEANLVQPEPAPQAAPTPEPADEAESVDYVPAPADVSEGAARRTTEELTEKEVLNIETDAKVFQYKGGGDMDGVLDTLKGIKKWDNNRSGLALVYEYEDGRRVIVDGHQRLGLAKRLAAEGQEVNLPVRILRERDGITEADARAIGAEKNIAEGSGTALDAAKVFRDTRKSARDLDLPMSKGMIRDADAMSKLSDNAFGMVINGVVTERDAAAVGEMVTQQERQADILGLLGKLKPANEVQRRAIVDQANSAQITETQDSLFGEEEVSANLYLERAKVFDRAMKDLGDDVRTFRTVVSRGETIADAGNVLDQDANAARLDQAAQDKAALSKLANSKGPISEALTEAARALKGGQRIGDAAQAFLAAARRAEEVGGTGRPQPRRAGDGDGQAQAGQGQTESIAPDRIEANNPTEAEVEDMFAPPPAAPNKSAPDAPRGTGRPSRDLFDNGDASQPGERQTDLEDLIDEANTRSPAPADLSAAEAEGFAKSDKTSAYSRTVKGSDGEKTTFILEPKRETPDGPLRIRARTSTTDSRPGGYGNIGSNVGMFDTVGDAIKALRERGMPSVDATGGATSAAQSDADWWTKTSRENDGAEARSILERAGVAFSNIGRPWVDIRASDQEKILTARKNGAADVPKVGSKVGQNVPKVDQNSNATIQGQNATPRKDGASSLTEAKQARKEELKAKIAAKIKNQLNAGLDPETVAMTAELVAIYVEEGVRKFRALVRAMMDDMGLTFEQAQPYARIAYNQARDDLELDGKDVSDMDDARAVLKEVQAMRQAEQDQAQDQGEAESPRETDLITQEPETGGAGVDAGERDQLAAAFSKAFAEGETFGTIVQARKRASEILGRDMTDADRKPLEEAIELGVVMRAREIAAAGMTEPETYEAMVDLYQAQPKLSERTSTSVEQQAYSTPAPLAYLASRLAVIDQNSKVYEPSAGNGMLLMEANPRNIVAVELNPDRAAALEKVLGPRATVIEADATQVVSQGYDTVITNPPFGKVKENGETKTFDLDGLSQKSTEIDHAIVARALDNMPDGGRAVLIIGGQKGKDEATRRSGYQTDKNRKFFKALYDNYGVLEHFTVDGKLYERQGAGWPVDVIVIQGKTSATKPYPMREAPPLYNDWAQIGERLDGTDSLDTRRIDGDAGVGGNRPPAETPDAERVPVGVDGPDREDGAAGAAGAGDVREDVPDAPAGTGAGVQRDNGGRASRAGQRRGERENGDAVPADTGEPDQADAGADAGGLGARAAGGVSRPVVPVERENTEAETAFQVQYAPASNARFAVGTLVPRNMQEAMSAALDALKSRVGDIDDFVSQELGYTRDQLLGTEAKPGYFSAEQVDALALAIDNVQQGAGFIIGDQTGVGKGRFVAAMLRYGERKGMVPVFVTQNPGLFKDMVRDMRDIGMADAHKKVFLTDGNIRASKALRLSDRENDILEASPPAKLQKGLFNMRSKGELPEGHSMLFTTYSQLQQVKGQDTERMSALRALASNAFFVLDESHEAGGVKPERAEKTKMTRGDFVRELLAEARAAVYSSATYAKNPHVMTLYSKTDLAMAADTMDQLAEAVAAGGVPFQQVMANMLVQSGQYARRERSYEGVKMGMEQLTTDVAMARSGAKAIGELFRLDMDVMTDVRAEFIENLKKDGMGQVLDGAVGEIAFSSTGFASMMHNVAAQLLLAIKVDAAVDKAIALFREGKKPIITVSNTNGAILDEIASEAGAKFGDALNVPFNYILERYLERLRQISYRDMNDKKHTIRMSDDDIVKAGGAVALDAFKFAEQQIRDANLDALTGAPIDRILDRLRDAGINADEITGRTKVLAGGILEKREASASSKIKAMDEFNRGDLDALVINRSGSTGFSLHATDRDGNDGKVRHMIVLQPEPNIDLFMQMLGRIHRTGQTQLPEFTIAISDLAVEKRPANVLMRKMGSLSANTTASKRSAVSLDNVVDFLNPYGDAVVADWLNENTQIAEMLDVWPKKTAAENDGIAQKFTGRLAVLDPDQVARIYDEIEGNYIDKIEALTRTGQNALEAQVLELDARTISSTEVVPAKDESRPFGAAAFIETVDIKRLGKPMSPDQVTAEVDRVSKGDPVAHLNQQLSTFDAALTAATAQNEARIAAAEARLAEEGTKKQKDRIADAVRRAKIAFAQDMENAENLRSRIMTLEPGAIGRLSIRNGDTAETYFAVSLGADTSKLDKNPTAASSIKVRFAIADAAREIPVPLSKMIGDNPQYSWDVLPERNRNMVMSAFAEGQTASRETRQMITGNVVAGFTKMQGKGLITMYRDSEGNLKQGVLLPKSMDVNRALENRPVVLTPSQAVEFLTSDGIGSRVVTSDNGVFRVSYNGTRFGVLVTAQGHKPFTLNKQVRDMIGDFQGRTGQKFHRAFVRDHATMAKVLQVYIDNLGASFQTTIDRAAARAITGEDVVQIGPDDTSGQVGMKFALRTPSRSTSGARAKAADIAKSLRREVDRLGLPSIDVQLVQSIVAEMGDGTKAQADGVYLDAVIYAAMDAGRDVTDTVRHEAIHALRDPRIWGQEFGLFKPAEWRALERYATAQADRMEQARQDNPELTETQLVEEVIADLFADYAAGRLKEAGFVRNALRAIERALEAIGNALRGNGLQSAEAVLERVESGAVGARQAAGAAMAARALNSTALTPKFAKTRNRADEVASDFIGEKVTHAVLPESSVQQRQETFLRAFATQPLDQVFRIPFHALGGLDNRGRWKVGARRAAWAKKGVKEAEFSEDSFMAAFNPIVRRVRAGMVDRYGLDEEYIRRERRRGLDEGALAAEGTEHLEALLRNKLSPEEAKALQAVLTGEEMGTEQMQKLAAPIAKSIDEMGAEAVELGLLSREAYERNRGKYLHRVYQKHEQQETVVGKFITTFAQGRRRKIIGKQFKGRGIFEEITSDRLKRDDPDFWAGLTGKPVKGEKVVVLVERVESGTPAMEAVGEGKPSRVVRKIYWPASKPIPAKYSRMENRGTFEVRGFKGDGKAVLWRDHTKDERRKMGEILDARYTIAKTYMLMSQDLANGRFFRDIAQNENWARKTPPDNAAVEEDATGGLRERMWANLDAEWVRVPNTKIGKSDTHTYGALAGMYVRAEIWRDMAEMQAMQTPSWWRQIMTQWKLNKTARSPVVHMNNVMSNLIFMDLADVRLTDLKSAIGSMARGDAIYQEALENGAFGADMVSQELRENVLKPMLQELGDDMRGGKGGFEAYVGGVGKLMDKLVRGAQYLDGKMIAAYQLEDQVFRLATYMRLRGQGVSVEEAAIEARDQFLNYDIRAPWVNAARATLLPFASYTYRAIPKIAQNLAERPWKVLKYFAITQALNAMAYAVAESEWDEEEERASMREDQQGLTWIRTPRMMRMPWLGGQSGDLPVFLDTRRWIPASDVFDMRGGDLPAWLYIGGPIVLGFELYFNHNSYFNEPIYNDVLADRGERFEARAGHAYKAWMPSAPWVPGSWYFDKIRRASGLDSDNGKPGLQFGGEPYTMSEALWSSVGVKLKPQDVDANFAIWDYRHGQSLREISAERSGAKRQFERGLINREQYTQSLQKLREMERELQDKRRELQQTRR